MLKIFVDADACPVKEEVYKVAHRYQLDVTLVANSRMRIPNEPWLSLQIVANRLDEADDWIVENIDPDDIVVTADILLAARCLKKGAHAISSTGRSFTETNIVHAIATRELLSKLRATGEITGGPPPLQKRDRSRFLQKLDEIIQSVLRNHSINNS